MAKMIGVIRYYKNCSISLKRMQSMSPRSMVPLVAVALAIATWNAASGQAPPARQDKGNSAGGRQPVDRQILAEAETVFPMAGDLVLRGYTNRRRVDQPAMVAHAVVMIHGVLRNPAWYYLEAKRVLERKSLFTKVAVISVGFDSPASAPGNVRRLAMFPAGWKHGDFGGRDPDDPENTLSSFAAMDRILVDLTRTYPQLKRITLIGHSAGAQFVDRYSVLTPLAAKLPQVAFRFVAIAPSTVLYPSQLRPKYGKERQISFTVRSGATEYDKYPYGLRPTPLLERLVGHTMTGPAPWSDRLLERNIVFAVGTEDTQSRYLDRSRAANAQGPNRYTRIENFAEFLKTQWPASKNLIHVL